MRKSLIYTFFFLASCFLATAQAPDFTVTDSDGKAHQLYADYVNQGKVVVLKIFFVGCPPCAAHAPHFQNLYQQMKSAYGDRVEFFLLSDKSADTNPLVAQYRTDRTLTMPGIGSDGGSLAAVQPYKSGQFGFFFGTPTFVVIAPNTGEVFYDVRGSGAAATMNLLGQKIADLLPSCRIRTPQGDTLQQYQLTVSVPGGGTAVSQHITDGSYALDDFSGLPPLPFFEAVPAKNDDPINGVSTFDLLQINKQILGIEPFLHNWQFVAADANNSGTVSTFDIVELRKLILGIYDTLPARPSWVFSPAKDTIWTAQCPEFVAIKIGDVNGNADANARRGPDDRGAMQWPVLLDNPPLTAGQTHIVRIRTDRSGAWAGLQTALRFDARAVQVRAVHAPYWPGFDKNAWHISEGRLAVSWLAPDRPVEVAEGKVFLEIELTALRDGPLAVFLYPEDAPLRSEAYHAENGVYVLDWQIAPPTATPAADLFPNPARGNFTLRLERAAPGPELLQLIDNQGTVVFEKVLQLDKGGNACTIVPGPIPPGMYAVRVGGMVAARVVWME